MYTPATFARTKREALEKLAAQINAANALYESLVKVTYVVPGPPAGQPGYNHDNHLLTCIRSFDHKGAQLYLHTRGRSDG
jgi:hypothetical protein